MAYKGKIIFYYFKLLGRGSFGKVYLVKIKD